jgi:ATP-dependent DNA helicase HFM1/MER3
MPNDKDVKLRRQYHADVALVFKHVQRLIRCIADCQISTGDSVALMNALLIQRSLHSRAWDDGPMHMRQIPSIGVVAVRKLVNAGIRTIEELEISEPHRIEMAIGRNPPFGRKVLEDVKRFPKLRVSVNALPNTVRIPKSASIMTLNVNTDNKTG